MRSHLRHLGWVLVAAIGAAGFFVLTTSVMDELPDTVLVLGAVVVPLVLSLAESWGPRLQKAATDRRPVLLAVTGGLLAFWAAPLLAFSQRATDSPPGTEALLFTCVAWGLFSALAAWASAEDRPAFTGPAAALLAAVGAATMLANWERPSSFSPFVRAPERALLMLGAAVLFAVGAVMLSRAIRRIGPGAASTVGLTAATLAAIVWALPSFGEAADSIGRVWEPLLLAGFAQYAFVLGWTRLLRSGGAARAAAPLLLAPPAVTALLLLERSTALYGATPIVWRGAVGGILVCVTGALALWFARPTSAEEDRSLIARASLGAAIAATVAGLIGLAWPSLAASAQGVLGETFAVSWSMLGIEAAAPMVAAAAALLAFGAAYTLRRGGDRIALIAASSAVLVSALCVYFVAETPLRTWTRWIPASVQQTYGTEYARFSVKVMPMPFAVGAALLASAAVVAILVAMSRAGRKADRLKEL